MLESRTGILYRKPSEITFVIGVIANEHAISPTNTYMDNAGNIIHGHNGGVWEWTSTPFEGYEGFVTSRLYPGYSSDFFDGKHFVVVSLSNFLSGISSSCLLIF